MFSIRPRKLRALILGSLISFGPLGWAAPHHAGREYWISVRQDGVHGHGTEGDPFDGSTATKLDDLFWRLPRRSTIHLGRGTFLTRGIQAKEGWRVDGMGKDQTTIKLADGVLTDFSPGRMQAVIFQYDFEGFFRYFELADLTIDCNRENQSVFKKNLRGYSLDAWVIAAKSAKIKNVRALGTWANPGEGFPCHVYHDGSRRNRDRIEVDGCENINPIGYLTAISVFDQEGGLVSGSIRHCRVTDHSGGAAFGAGGWRNFTVANNYTRNVAIPIVIDTNDYYNVQIFGNRFVNCLTWGVLCNGGGVYRNINIHDNVFDMRANAADPVVNTGDADISLRVHGNRFLRGRFPTPVISRGPHTRLHSWGNIVRHKSANSQPVED